VPPRCATRYTADLLAVGATKGPRPPIPCRELGGIHQAMEYLPLSNKVSRATT